MARAVCKVTVHKKGGAKNAEYIGRPMEGEERTPGETPEDGPQASRQITFDVMREAETAEFAWSLEQDDDPVWTWNAPREITGDAYGNRESFQATAFSKDSTSSQLAPSQSGTQPEHRFSVEEKRERVIGYFSALSDLEERRGGVTHFRLIITVGPEVTNRQLKSMVNAFLGKNFPLAEAFVAIHRDTEHTHAHLYVHARQLDNQRVHLGQRYFHLDESWMQVCAEQLGDREIYEKHMKLKAVTLEWKERAIKARERGEPVPPKDDRWGDHHDTRLSFRPWDDTWCGRLMAQVRVAESKVEYLTVTKGRKKEITAASREAEELRERLDSVVEKRRATGRSDAKRRMPSEIITISEARDLIHYERAIQNRSKGAQPEPNILEATASGQRSRERVAGQGVFEFEGTHPALEERSSERNEEHQSKKLTAEGKRQRSSRRPHEGQREGEATLLPIDPTASLDNVPRVLGRELMAEARLAYAEYYVSVKGARKGLTQLKEQLVAARQDHARAHEEAEQCRAQLSAQGIGAPPCHLTAEEQKYIKFVSRYVAEGLRERIRSEVSRSLIIPEKQIELGFVLRPPEEAKTPQKDAAPSKESLPAPAKRVTAVPTMTLPDNEVWKLIIDLEFAGARAAAQRVEENDFKVRSHRWPSPSQNVSLSQIQQQITASIKQGKPANDLIVIRKEIQLEIAGEREALSHRRSEAEAEVKRLSGRLREEQETRAALNLSMPVGKFTEEDLRQLTAYTESARDPQLLKRVFEIERSQAEAQAQATKDKMVFRRLEEKYAGLEIKAEVASVRSQKALDWSLRHPEQLMLPVKDAAGYDITVSLEDLQSQKGIKGLFKKVMEKREQREFREQLIATKDSYLQHLQTDSKTRSAFYEATQLIAQACRIRSKELGFTMPVPPELTRVEIQEIRDYARNETSVRGHHWLAGCVQAERLRESKETALTRPSHVREELRPDPAVLARREIIEKQIAKVRARMEQSVARTRSDVNPLRPEVSKEQDRNERAQIRPSRGGSRGR